MIDQDMIDEAALAWDNEILQAEAAVELAQADKEAVRKLLAALDRDVIALNGLYACPRGILTYVAARSVEGGLEYALRNRYSYWLWVRSRYWHGTSSLPRDLVDAYLNVSKDSL